ncbi:DELLA protein RGL1-like [Juglans microcarpa x Juglans regia]|uniref:DELLA protein RGL1-like n=1 Tax=Juglans microcarpa x Juglans regia TaxID=2249226 RepID=UPI001B7DE6C8|nr:DELLA protein RGL1-like [Juglans microcarpa x Juglans regia]
MDKVNGGKYFYQEDLSEEDFNFSQHQQQQVSFSEIGFLDDLQFHAASPPLHTCLEEIAKLGEFPTLIPEVEPQKRKRQRFSLASLELLKNYGNRFKQFNGDKVTEPSNDVACTKVEDPKLSTEEIVRLAGAKFIQSTSQPADGPSRLSHPFHLDFCGLSDEERRDVELAESLFASAEKVGSQQFERARKFLNQCDHLSSTTGNPVQRVVYFFSEALREKIDRETGRNTSKDSGKRPSINVDEELMSSSPPTLAAHEELPFSQVTQFAGIQAIIENTVEARKIHIIDLGIHNGVQWTILMQALATRCECPLELLKITAIGTTSKHLLVETGKRLASFAQSLNLPFSFNVVMVSDMLDLREDLFELDADETVAFYSAYLLRSMITRPNQLESIMKVVRSINPCIMIVTEVEASHNSPAFVSRFVEALFFFSAFFDCLETFMKRDDQNRMITESKFFGEGIRNIVAAEGEERKIRHVKIDVWRAFFARYGMVETELSRSSLYQATMLVKKFHCEKSFTLDMNGKCLITVWKGTPICSLSAWKFLSQ